MLRIWWLFLLVGVSVAAWGQAQDREFFLNGKAVQLNDSCFQLTRSGDMAAVGSIWYPDKIDLRNSFDLVMEMSFGCDDLLGADGIVFGLQPVSASVGTSGEGLGIGGIAPALAVEFDTYQNIASTGQVDRLDPVFDHIAIMANGASTHAGPDNLAGPVPALTSGGNIENCGSFPLRVTWDAALQTLRVYFNCELRIEYTGNVIRDIFKGDPFVYYGFAAATGGLTNTQEVCFTFNSFEKQLTDVTMCPGGQVLLDVTGGETYEWSPAAGLSSSTAASVEASPDSTTVYTVKIFDGCGLPLLDTVRITVAGDSAFVKLGPDTTLCPGERVTFDVTVPTAVYTWSDSSLRGPVVNVADAGTYSVTATRTDIVCTASDRVVVGTYQLPNFDLGRADTSLCFGDELRLELGVAEGQVFLDPDVPVDSLTITGRGTYRFTYEHPCAVLTDAITVSFSNCRRYYLPTAFSPNGDGRNDLFYPQDAGDVLRVHRFAVHDRWGALLYESTTLVTNAPDLGWDGTVGGRQVPTGTYVWSMDTDFRDGQRSVERGSVTVVR